MQLLMGAIATVALLIAGYIGYKIRDRQTRAAVGGYEWFCQKWLSRSGVHIGYGSYRLESLDGGKNWYATEWTEDGQVKILGPAESCFPGLLKRLRAFDQLIDYAQRHGPLTLTGPNAALEICLLESAGFTVKRNAEDQPSEPPGEVEEAVEAVDPVVETD